MKQVHTKPVPAWLIGASMSPGWSPWTDHKTRAALDAIVLPRLNADLASSD